MMRESPTASAMRIVERDLERSLVAMRELVNVVEEAVSHLRIHDHELAARLRSDAFRIVYGQARSPTGGR
jgi:hypothetical protein